MSKLMGPEAHNALQDERERKEMNLRQDQEDRRIADAARKWAAEFEGQQWRGPTKLFDILEGGET